MSLTSPQKRKILLTSCCDSNFSGMRKKKIYKVIGSALRRECYVQEKETRLIADADLFLPLCHRATVAYNSLYIIKCVH